MTMQGGLAIRAPAGGFSVLAGVIARRWLPWGHQWRAGRPWWTWRAPGLARLASPSALYLHALADGGCTCWLVQ